MKETIEIERKWLIKQMPDIAAHQPEETHEITQSYLPVSGLRLRQKDDTYLITLKSSGRIARSEWEESLPKWAYQELIGQAVGSLRKTRYVFHDGEQLLEVDVYHDNLEGLITVEAESIVELEASLSTIERQEQIKAAEASAEAYALPSWISDAIDVTEDKTYSNHSLATKGLPAKLSQAPF